MIDSLINQMKKPSFYGKDVKKVDLIQTHISFVFLTGKYVYKIKKPVNFEFLDFTSLEKRKFFCEEELRLNKRLSPEIYLEVLPITKSNANFEFNGDGEVIEYALKMKQIPQETIMTNLLIKDKIDTKIVDKIAKILADFHSNTNPNEEVDKYGSLETIRANWLQNFEQTTGLRGSLVSKELFDDIKRKINEFMEENKDLFESRLKNKRIRECHGDVHSGNIFIHDKIHIFDAIEFNKAFSCSDVAAEVAFLAMDLDFHGKNNLSKHFVEKYIEYSNDKEMHELLNFYKAYRAYVRAKVTSFKLNDTHISEEEKQHAEKLTKKYFNLAFTYLNN